MTTTFETEVEEFVMPQPSAFVLPDSLPMITGPNISDGKVPIIAGFIPAGALIPDYYVIPYYDHRTKEGYQRPPQKSRISELARDLRRKQVDLPTAILLNIRNKEAEAAFAGGKLDLQLLRSTSAQKLVFHVVDGQHRVLALEKLIEENPDDDWESFRLPFVCMLGADPDQEMEQFYIVNTKAKSVRTDLAYALLRKRAENDPAVMSKLIETGKTWQVHGEEIVEAMTEKETVWRGLIRLPGMDKGNTTIPSASFVNSLRSLLNSPFFGQLPREQQLRVLEAFWRGVRDVLPDAFDEPSNFVIQKGLGASVMHETLVMVLEIARNHGRSVVEADTFAEILGQPLEDLDGETQQGRVTGLDFWRVAPEGAAGSYSSSAGRRTLNAKIRALLPPMEAL